MFRTLTLLTVGACLAAIPASAQTTAVLTTLRSFNGVNGQSPRYGLTRGADGDFYGVTAQGGANNEGAFFRVFPDGTLTLLHSFDYNADGGSPQCSLVQASDGNFYGTSNNGGPGGNGTVFQATPSGTVTILHAFSDNAAIQGESPVGGVVQGRDGFLYGTTSNGGTNDNGTLFRVGVDGTFTSLYAFNFQQTGAGPHSPASPLVQGSDGNFYGVAGGGDNAIGTIYQLTPAGIVTTIHSFNKTDGLEPTGPLVEGSPGVFYGLTTGGGGTDGNGYGTIFKVTDAGQLTTLHIFTADNGDSYGVTTGFTLGTGGNLYTTTVYGGSYGFGTILQCTLAGTVTILYSFNDTTSTSPTYAFSGVTQASDGSLYGLTADGGPSNYGVVYHLTFDSHPPFFDGQADLANGVEYLQFASGNPFGYYSFLSDPHYLYHFDLGYEYVFDAADGNGGVYLYDFKSSTFFYTSPVFPFPYLYDFGLSTVLYYYPDPKNAGRYNTDGIRYFYNFSTGKVITK